MSSSRLPGKVLMKINGITSLECLLNQVTRSKKLNKIVIATSTNLEDDPIYNFAKTHDYDVFRGSLHNVLDRYYQCAKKFHIQNIVRITADDPLIDPEMLDMVIDEFLKNKSDYLSNCQVRTFPYGTEVEVFSFNALEKTWREAKLPDEKEHVTQYIQDHPEIFTSKCIESKNDLSNFRWTVDEKEDFEFVRNIYAQIKKRPILMSDILTLIRKNPSLLDINKKTVKKYQGK